MLETLNGGMPRPGHGEKNQKNLGVFSSYEVGYIRVYRREFPWSTLLWDLLTEHFRRLIGGEEKCEKEGA